MRFQRFDVDFCGDCVNFGHMKSLLGMSAALAMGGYFFMGSPLQAQSDAPTSAPSELPPPQTVPAHPAPWPRQFTADALQYTVYQPQLESWDGRTLKSWAAVQVSSPTTDGAQSGNAMQPVYGYIVMDGTTDVDKAARMVTLSKINITQINFPSAQDKQDAFLVALRAQMPDTSRQIALDDLEAALAVAETVNKNVSVHFDNTPPAFVFSPSPMLMVQIEDSAVYTPVASTNLQRLVNTRALILKAPDGTHYLHLFDGWLSAPDLNGQWEVVTAPPADLQTALDAAVSAKQVDLLAGQPNPDTQAMPSLKTDPVPSILIATVPTELIVTEGDLSWSEIDGTSLAYANNTIASFFRDESDLIYYMLAAGRWFKTGDYENGPWTFVPGASLPGDFAKIPVNSPKENVLASIPGTPQASEAFIANSIPQTSLVELATTQPNTPIAFQGDPVLAPITGTTLQYVQNSQAPVIRVSEHEFFALSDGVWFTATAATGPWIAASSVPDVIYTIPPASPVYYATYVRLYNSGTEGTVTVGTFPGYYGAMPSGDGTVVFGTGYNYPNYVEDDIFIGSPVTYGYGTNLYWTPWAGWYMGFGAAIAWGNEWGYRNYAPVAPYWGGYWGATYGWHYNAAGGIKAWGPYGWAGASGHYWAGAGPRAGVTNTVGGYNPWTGNAAGAQSRYSYNSRTGASNAVYRAGEGNVYTGNYADSAAGARINPRTGAVTTGEKTTAGNAYTGANATVGSATRVTATGNVQNAAGVRTDNGAAVDVNGNVYAGRNGNVYSRNDDGGWNNLNGGDNDLQRDNNLDRDFDSRNLGSNRASAFSGARAGGFGEGLGGMRGGGGGRR